MNDSKIAVRYAKALFLSAKEKKVLDKVYNDVVFVLDICRQVNELMDLFHSPIIPASKKKIIVREVFRADVNKLTLNFLDLIILNKRETFIPDIARRFISVYKKHKGFTSATLTTATPVDREVRNRIIDLIDKAYKTKVDLAGKVEESLIGGFVLRIEDHLLNASVSSELKKIKRELTGKY
jgi:F-type H+-transporting ATPase subunit delta